MSQIIQDSKGQLVEEHCCMKFQDKEFCANGSYLWTNPKTGRLEGILYLHDKGESIGTWDYLYNSESFIIEDSQV